MTKDEARALVEALPEMNQTAICRLVEEHGKSLTVAESVAVCDLIWDAAVQVKFERKRAEFGIGGVT